MKTAIVLMNLGGPDRVESVAPFLVNLFSDPAILTVPGFIRPLLARFIARRRAPVAREIYQKLGGGSPILPNTMAQARALEAVLAQPSPNDAGANQYRCFVAMRYWHPFTAETVAAVADWQPDRIVLLPLYPQYSTATTESSLDAWHRAARRARLTVSTHSISAWPTEPGFIAALADETRKARAELPADADPLYLFSAHGLPERLERKRKDPYATQVKLTSQALAAALGLSPDAYVTCFQSRVGPVEWIKPYTDRCVVDAGAKGRSIVVVPIAFVSEHSETLVELDIELREIAHQSGVPFFARAHTVGTNKEFIAGLAALVRGAVASDDGGGAGRMPGNIAATTRSAARFSP